MRLRNIPGARETIAASEYVVHEDVMREKKGKWDTVFEKAQPLYLEVGMGNSPDGIRKIIMSGSKNIRVCCCVP